LVASALEVVMRDQRSAFKSGVGRGVSHRCLTWKWWKRRV
jgi:hypothetical protein